LSEYFLFSNLIVYTYDSRNTKNKEGRRLESECGGKRISYCQQVAISFPPSMRVKAKLFYCSFVVCLHLIHASNVLDERMVGGREAAAVGKRWK
jgi:hypothetical protein